MPAVICSPLIRGILSPVAYRHTSPQDAPKRHPRTTSEAPGESNNFVAVLLLLGDEPPRFVGQVGERGGGQAVEHGPLHGLQLRSQHCVHVAADGALGAEVLVHAEDARVVLDGLEDAAMHLADALSGTEVRLVIVGGAGSLFVDPEHTKTVVDVTPFPEEAMPVVNTHGKLLEQLRGRDDVRWTYVNPAGDFKADGERTGEYQLGGRSSC